MTQITLASKDSTPQVHGPFAAVLTDLTTSYATGQALFTPPDGAIVVSAWCIATGAGPDGSVSAIVTNGDNVSISLTPFDGRSYVGNQGGMSTGVPLRLIADGAGFDGGTADVYVLVLPVPAA